MKARDIVDLAIIAVSLTILTVWAALEPIGDPRQGQSIATPPAYGGVR